MVIILFQDPLLWTHVAGYTAYYTRAIESADKLMPKVSLGAVFEQKRKFNELGMKKAWHVFALGKTNFELHINYPNIRQR